MTTEQQQDLKFIQHHINGLLETKYKKGQAEHGGNLWEKPAFGPLVEEVTDLVTYTITLRNQLAVYYNALRIARDCYQNNKPADGAKVLDHVIGELANQLK